MSNELQNTLDRILIEKNTKLIPENIKEGITILGVVGNAKIDMTDATATPDDIVAGKTAYLKDGIATGTMVNNGTITITPSKSNQTIPAGYHNGNGIVRGVTASIDSNIKDNNIKAGVNILGVIGTLDVLDTSDATANRSTILSGSTAYVDGVKITGAMANNGRLNYTPSTRAQTIPSGYTSGGTISAVTASIDSNIKAGNIKKGVTILGVEGNLSDNGIDTSDATAGANHILSGKTAYVNSEKITGSMANRGSLSVTPSTNRKSYSAGYYSGISIDGVTSSIDGNIQPSNIKQGVTILGVTGTVVSEDVTKITETISPITSGNIVRNNTYYNKLTITPVTSNIDGNIQPYNIKEGVTILGVTGTMSATVSYEAGTLTVLSGRYINYNPIWKAGTILESDIQLDDETDMCSISGVAGYTLIKCYFNFIEAQTLEFQFDKTSGVQVQFSNLDSSIENGIHFDTTSDEITNVKYENVSAGNHYVEIKLVINSTEDSITLTPIGTNIRQKIVSQIYASLDAMHNDKSQSVGTYAFIYNLVMNRMESVYRYNGEMWVERYISNYNGTLTPTEYQLTNQTIDAISGEEIVL